jgi:dihydrofolate reductase
VTKGESTVTIHMGASLDGFIEKTDASVDWFNTSDSYPNGAPDPDAEAFLKTIGCYVMGSKTYELALRLGWIYGDTPVIVLTRRKLATDRATVEFYGGDLEPLVSRLRQQYGNVWVAGGARVAAEFIRLKLADEVSISILPILLGQGTRYFEYLQQEQPLHLKSATAYRNGVIEVRYGIIKKKWRANCNLACTMIYNPPTGAAGAAAGALAHRSIRLLR